MMCILEENINILEEHNAFIFRLTFLGNRCILVTNYKAAHLAR
jgi:hypothetical protein